MAQILLVDGPNSNGDFPRGRPGVHKLAIRRRDETVLLDASKPVEFHLQLWNGHEVVFVNFYLPALLFLHVIDE